MTISKIILNSDKTIPFDDKSLDSMAKLEKFVIDTYGSRDVDVTQIFTPRRRLNFKTNLKVNLQFIEGGVDSESVPIESLPTYFPEINRTLTAAVMDCLKPENRYYICFDQLDYGLNTDDENYSLRIIGLILACREINLAAREAAKNLTVGVFLRDDIYSMLHFEDKNKITENYVSYIEWDSQGTSHTLKGLMEKRFYILLREGGEGISWDNVFDEDHEMTGRQKKYNHILDRTFNRPRDIIKFGNLLLEKFRIRKSDDPTSSDKFTNEDINRSRDEYSTYFLNEIDDEIHKHIPNYNSYLDALRSIGTWHFTLEDFTNKLQEMKLGDDASEAMQKLYNFSIIGFLRTGGRISGSQYIFRYKNSIVAFDVRSTRFRVHPGLIESLDLKRTSSAAENENLE